MNNTDICHVCSMIDDARIKCAQLGEYSDSISCFETAIKLLRKMSANCRDNNQLSECVTNLLSNCRTELKVLQKLVECQTGIVAVKPKPQSAANNRVSSSGQGRAVRGNSGGGGNAVGNAAGSKDSNNSNQGEDPDVWPPATPVDRGRDRNALNSNNHNPPNSNQKVPSWARPKEEPRCVWI